MLELAERSKLTIPIDASSTDLLLYTVVNHDFTEYLCYQKLKFMSEKKIETARPIEA
jgi:hypothetical protein